MPGMLRLTSAILALLMLGAGPADDGSWSAGGYSFSDEFGGFRIRGVSGTVTSDDPIVLSQELYSASAVVLVVRIIERSLVVQEGRMGMTLYLELDVVNASGLPWVEFALELQAQLGKPSTYGDGLSFDQLARVPGTIGSSAFAAHKRDFEPFDGLLFQRGNVDPLESVSFSILITDLTPTHQFHLVLDPRIPFS